MSVFRICSARFQSCLSIVLSMLSGHFNNLTYNSNRYWFSINARFFSLTPPPLNGHIILRPKARMLFCIVTCCITTQSAEGDMKNLEGVGNRKDPTKSVSLPSSYTTCVSWSFLFWFCRYTMGVYQAYWVQELGVMSPTRASLVSSTLFVMTCVPSPLISILIHKSGRFRPSLMVAMAIPMLTSKN